jgi:hypothetical protein
MWQTALVAAVMTWASSAGLPGQEQPGRPVIPAQIRGTYGSPAAFWKSGARLSDYHINAVFLHHGGSDAEYERALREGALVFAEFGIFRDQRLAKERPEELWPVGVDGRPVQPTERFLGLCPTCERYNRDKLQQLRELLRRRPRLAGVWLDYLHFHCDFELPQPPLTQTCFNDSCLESFRRHTGIEPQGAARADKARWILQNQAGRWADWKCAVITDFARRARAVVDEERPGMLLGIYSCPWTDEEYQGGLRTIVGEDILQLSRYVDVWSPMVYHGNCERDAGWAERYTAWLKNKLEKAGARGRIWPIVQGGGTPKARPPVTAAGFETALRGPSAGGAGGVMFYHFAAVAADPEKLAVLKRVYAELAREDKDRK